MPRPPAFDQQITFLYAEDRRAAWAFYEDVLGFPLALDQGGCRIYWATGAAGAAGGVAFIGVCGVSAARPAETNGVVVTFVTPHVAAWAEWLRANGAEIVDGPRFNPETDITHVFFRDPAGYLLEAQTFHDPAWPGVG